MFNAAFWIKLPHSARLPQVETHSSAEYCKSAFLKTGSVNGCQGFREKKMRDDGRDFILAVLNS
jgi:hypothetical protein